MPIGFAMELAENPEAMNVFSGMDETRRAQALNMARNAKTREDMRGVVNAIARQAR